MPLRWLVLLFAPLLGCAGVPTVRLEAGPRRIAYQPAAEARPVEISERAFLDAVTRLALEARLSLRPADAPFFGAREETDHGRVRFVSFRGASPRRAGGVLELAPDEKRELALSHSLDTVWEGVERVVGATVQPEVLRKMVVTAMGAFMLMILLPEPVTKLIAVALSAYLVAYLGVVPLLNLVEAFRDLRDDAAGAASFAELEEIGHRFGRVLGDNGARVMVMLVLASTSRGGLRAQGPTLPGYGQAALAAESQAGFQLAAAASGGVRAIGIASSGLTVALAPTAVASMAWGPPEQQGGAPPRLGREVRERVVESSRERVGETTQGARAIAKKRGHATADGRRSAFDGVEPTQSAAEDIIRHILDNPTRTAAGRTVDVYGANGMGVRFDAETNQFIGFLEESLATR